MDQTGGRTDIFAKRTAKCVIWYPQTVLITPTECEHYTTSAEGPFALNSILRWVHCGYVKDTCINSQTQLISDIRDNGCHFSAQDKPLRDKKYNSERLLTKSASRFLFIDL